MGSTRTTGFARSHSSAPAEVAAISKRSPATVRAAGGLVVRPSDGGPLEVAIVHRPRYDDWTFPKGKLEDGETPEEAAVREVEEETGILAELGPQLHDVVYEDRHGRQKVASYWLMHPVKIRARKPDDEVDEVRWIPLAETRDILSYERDERVLDAAIEHLGNTVRRDR